MKPGVPRLECETHGHIASAVGKITSKGVLQAHKTQFQMVLSSCTLIANFKSDRLLEFLYCQRHSAQHKNRPGPGALVVVCTEPLNRFRRYRRVVR